MTFGDKFISYYLEIPLLAHGAKVIAGELPSKKES